VNANEKRPGASRELRGAESKKSDGPFFVSSLPRRVNKIHVAGLLFGRDLLLAGLAICGWPWSRRLSLWVDWLDARAEELREQQGVRA
jgi:hypothetical protein